MVHVPYVPQIVCLVPIAPFAIPVPIILQSVMEFAFHVLKIAIIVLARVSVFNAIQAISSSLDNANHFASRASIHLMGFVYPVNLIVKLVYQASPAKYVQIAITTIRQHRSAPLVIIIALLVKGLETARAVWKA